MATPAPKSGFLIVQRHGLSTAEMTTLSTIGRQSAELPPVHALTDEHGFGLAGHLIDMLTPRELAAEIDFNALPLLPGLQGYVAAGVIPGGTTRNYDSFGQHVQGVEDMFRRAVVCDPQTSGGLLIALAPEALGAAKALFQEAGIAGRCHVIGKISADGVNVRVF